MYRSDLFRLATRVLPEMTASALYIVIVLEETATVHHHPVGNGSLAPLATEVWLVPYSSSLSRPIHTDG